MAERAQKSLDHAYKAPTPASSRLTENPRSPPASRSPSMHLNALPSPTYSNRHSFSESLRGVPPSPRQSRQFSMSSAGVQDLMNNPPKAGAEDPAFAGRDWHDIAVGELVDPAKVLFVEVDTGIEEATNVGVQSQPFHMTCHASLTSTAALDRLWKYCSPRTDSA